MFLSFLLWGLFAVVLLTLIVGAIWVINLVSNLFLTLRESSALVSYPRVQADEVDFQSEDGIRLKGKFIKAQGMPAKGTVLFCQEADGTMDSCAKYTSY